VAPGFGGAKAAQLHMLHFRLIGRWLCSGCSQAQSTILKLFIQPVSASNFGISISS
jgi:hypothetical protein